MQTLIGCCDPSNGCLCSSCIVQTCECAACNRAYERKEKRWNTYTNIQAFSIFIKIRYPFPSKSAKAQLTCERALSTLFAKRARNLGSNHHAGRLKNSPVNGCVLIGRFRKINPFHWGVFCNGYTSIASGFGAVP